MHNNYCGNFVASSHKHNRQFWCYSKHSVKLPRYMLTLHALHTSLKASNWIFKQIKRDSS